MVTCIIIEMCIECAIDCWLLIMNWYELQSIKLMNAIKGGKVEGNGGNGMVDIESYIEQNV